MSIAPYIAAITAHVILFAALAFTTLAFTAEPIVLVVVLAVGTAIVAVSAWQSVRGIRNGEPLREALCWLWD